MEKTTDFSQNYADISINYYVKKIGHLPTLQIITWYNRVSKCEFIAWTHCVIYTFWKIQLMLLDLSRPLSIWKYHWSSYNYQNDS